MDTIRMFAVGVAKGWVQLRVAKREPRVVTSMVKLVPYKRPCNFRVQGAKWVHDMRTIRPTMKLETIVGGRVVKILPASQFRKLTRIGVGKGGMLELTQKMRQQLGVEGHGQSSQVEAIEATADGSAVVEAAAPIGEAPCEEGG